MSEPAIPITALLQAVPDELRRLPRWVLWRLRHRGAKPTKVPLTVARTPASITDPSTWLTFDEAANAWAAAPEAFSGLGFVFVEGDGLFGVDLDDCIDPSGRICESARALLGQFATYSEVSPSGRGIKFFCRGTLPTSTGRNVKRPEHPDLTGIGGVEVYSKGRFFTVTGSIIDGMPSAVVDCSEAGETLLAKLERRRPSQAPISALPPSSRPSAFERCRAYVLQLPPAISGSGGHDATLKAACTCFRFGMTLDEAKQIMDEFNRTKTGGEPWTERELQHKLDDAQRLVTEAGEFGKLRDEGALRIVRSDDPSSYSARIDFALTDTGNAERFAAMHGNNVRFLRYGKSDSGHWLVWTGNRWAPDARGQVWQLAKETTRSIYAQAASEPNTHKREALAKWAVRSESENAIRAMVGLARSEPPVPITPADLDADPWLLNVENGTLDLRTGELRGHRRGDYITKLCPVAYDPQADAGRFLRFLDEIMPGMDEVKSFLQRLVGQFLTGDIREHVLPIFYGSGRNGKNTLIDTLMGLLGEYAAPAPPNLLTARNGGDEHPTEIADACGKRLLVASETEEGRQLRVALVKSLTGDRYLKGRFMRQDYFTFERTHKTVLLTNNRPKIQERSAAIWGRVLLIPFNVSFAGREDTSLPDILRQEWPGILAWAVRGCLAWQRTGLRVPEAVRAATLEYQAEQDVLGPFLDDCCTLESEARVPRSDIWTRYVEWAKRAGERAIDRNGLYQRLRERGFTDERFRDAGRLTRGFKGIGIIVPEGSAAGSVTGAPPVTGVWGLSAMEQEIVVIPESGVTPGTGDTADSEEPAILANSPNSEGP